VVRSALHGLILVAALLAACKQSLTPTGTGTLPGGHGTTGHGGSGGWSTSTTGAAGGDSVSGTGSSGPITGVGPGDVGGASGASSCAAFAAMYDAAIAGAQLCSAGALGQCGQIVNAHLSACGSCPTYVNDARKLAEIKSQWQQMGCDQSADGGTCGQVLCPVPTNNTCAAGGDGTARCSFVPSGTTGGGNDGGVVCDQLQQAYRLALLAAQTCDSDGGACDRIVPVMLSVCPVCTTSVVDSSQLAYLGQEWHDAGCDVSTPCPPVDACPPPQSNACVPVFEQPSICVYAGQAACADLARQYQAAIPAAQACQVGAPGQCVLRMPDMLTSCPACSVYVTDTTALSAIQQRWLAGGCGAYPADCPDALCAPAAKTTCTATDAGGGVCTTIYGSPRF
jgi:hypothetical protein